jgi:hypothetical protein
MSYPWYETVAANSDELLQGDLVYECPIVKPPEAIIEGDELDFEIELINVIVLSQSCDIENKKLQNVLVCPFRTLRDYFAALPPEQNSKKSLEKHFDQLRQGYQPNYHLLNKEPEYGIDDFIIADFRNIYGVHLSVLKSHVQKLNNRVRLLPPYREHLSQALARFFMRVGLPQNIPHIDLKDYMR